TYYTFMQSDCCLISPVAPVHPRFDAYHQIEAERAPVAKSAPFIRLRRQHAGGTAGTSSAASPRSQPSDSTSDHARCPRIHRTTAAPPGKRLETERRNPKFRWLFSRSPAG